MTIQGKRIKPNVDYSIKFQHELIWRQNKNQGIRFYHRNSIFFNARTKYRKNR